MAFDEEKAPGDDLEEFGDELSSDYREEEEGANEEEELEEEVSYEAEVTTPPAVAPPPPASPSAARSAATVRKPAKKTDRKSTRLNSSHIQKSRMPSSA